MAPKYLNKLQGHRVVVIGGSKGIGYGVAEAAMEFGAIVTVASSSQANVDKAVQQLQSSYPDAASRVSGHTVDTECDDVEASLTALFNFASSDGAHEIDHVVFTAGRYPTDHKPIPDTTVAQLDAHHRARYVAVIMAAQVASRHFKRAHTSSFTMTSGALAFKPRKGVSTAVGLASATVGLARGFAVDLAPVRANVVVPGAIRTDLLEGFAGGDPSKVEETLKAFAAGSLLDRVGTVEDMAELYLGIMKSGFITGTTVMGEGGYLLK